MEYINKMLAKENPAPLCDLTPHFLHRVGDSLFSAFVVKTADRKRLAEALKHSHPDVPHWATVKAGAWPRAHVPSAEGGPGGGHSQVCFNYTVLRCLPDSCGSSRAPPSFRVARR